LFYFAGFFLRGDLFCALPCIFVIWGNGTFQKAFFALPSGPGILAAGDLNHDGYPDIVTADDVTFTNTTASINILLNAGATTLAPNSIIFSGQLVGTTSDPQTVTLTNSGTKTLSIGGISFTGTNATSFSQTHTCMTTLAAGASCNIFVKFSPNAAGFASAALTLRDNGVGSPQTVALAGTGTP